jgi:hypothetical protein
MTRATHATRQATSPTEELLPAWVADARAEIAALRVRVRAPRLADSTRTEYERRAKRLAGGKVELVGVCKRELALWKAAGKWKMGERVREAMNEADMLWRHGRRVVEVGPDGRKQVRREPFASNADKWRAWRAAVGTIRQRAAELEAFLAEADGWKAASGRTGDAVVRKEASHKKRPFRPGEAKRFFAAVGSSAFRPALLAAYFCGARPQEFAGGVTVRRALDKATNQPGLLLTIHDRAKQDGDKKGQAQGRIFIADASVSSDEARALFDELRELALDHAGEIKIEVAPTGRQSTGQRLTQAARHFALQAFPAGERPSFYSLRQTFSRNVKAAARERHGGDTEAAAVEVAQALGHQSTETARHYGRASRAAGEFAPESRLQAAVAAPVRHYGSGAGPQGRRAHATKQARQREAKRIAAGLPPSKPAPGKSGRL